MAHFIVNPPIKDDRDYYRFDDQIVERVLSGESMLALGLRRSGKTSFLNRIERAAQRVGKPVVSFDIQDFFLEGKPDEEAEAAALLIARQPDAIILLDEVEIFGEEHSSILANLAKACLKRTVVMSCAPAFVLDFDKQPSIVQILIEPFYRHYLGALSREEANALLSQKHRSDASPVSLEVIAQVLETDDRLPLILQAIGAQYADHNPLVVSLAGAGPRILSGLTARAKEVLVEAAHGGSSAPNSKEVELLVALGALRVEKKARSVLVAGQILAGLIRNSIEHSRKGTVRPEAVDQQNWNRHARILHLSDLHFGPHCTDKTEHAIDKQLKRLTDVLERDAIAPDFIAVTGDLSWSGHKSELEAAERFLEGIVQWCVKVQRWKEREARARVLIIPGNHDAAWALTNSLQPDQTEDWVCYSLAPLANIVHRFHRGAILWDLNCLCDVRQFKKPDVAFIWASTCHFISQGRKQGEFGERLQEKVVNLLNRQEVKRALFRLVLIHHNLRPFHKDQTSISDGEQAAARFAKCQPGIDLVLHGHVHQGEVDIFKPRGNLREIQYSAVGSFGVRAEHRPGDDERGRVPNEFAVVDLESSDTGRRFATQIYHLMPTTIGGWKWKKGEKFSPRPL